MDIVMLSAGPYRTVAIQEPPAPKLSWWDKLRCRLGFHRFSDIRVDDEERLASIIGRNSLHRHGLSCFCGPTGLGMYYICCREPVGLGLEPSEIAIAFSAKVDRDLMQRRSEEILRAAEEWESRTARIVQKLGEAHATIFQSLQRKTSR